MVFYIRVFPTLSDGPEDWLWPIDRWDVQYTSPPASSDGSEARRFTRTIVPIDHRHLSMVILHRRSCLSVMI